MHRFVLPALFAFVCCLTTPTAQAAGDPFSVGGINVDASAASATEAQTMAINQGRARAWATLYHRLTKAQDWPRQPKLDDVALQRLIRSYVVGNERRSTTRFVATMTYIFNADAVRRLFRQSNIAYADMQAHPILIVPMAPNYQPRGGWTSVWASPRFSTGSVPLLVPAGDVVDVSALGGLSFVTASWQDVEPIASRIHAQEAFLVMAQTVKGQIVVKLRRLGPGAAPSIPDIVTPVPPKAQPAQAFAAAADTAASTIIDVWKGRAAVDFSKRTKLIAEVHVASLSEWSAVLQKLGTIPIITDVGVQAMDVGEARIAISYVGTTDQLSQLLAQANLGLSNENGTWKLSAQAADADAPSQ